MWAGEIEMKERKKTIEEEEKDRKRTSGSGSLGKKYFSACVQ